MPFSDPQQSLEYHRRWAKENPESRKAIVVRYKEKSKGKAFRDSDARRRYGISSYEEMKNIRNSPCEICGKIAKKMCIDHDGPSGVFNQSYRGVLCQQCNIRLGWFERRMEKILSYIDKEAIHAC